MAKGGNGVVFPGHSLRDRVALAVNFNRTPTLSHINYDINYTTTSMGMVDN